LEKAIHTIATLYASNNRDVLPFDALFNCNFDFTAEVSLSMDCTAVIEYLRTNAVLFTLWFVPTFTKIKQSDQLDEEDCFKVCSSKVPLDYLLSTKNDSFSKKHLG
jgi:hypothetical protein